LPKKNKEIKIKKIIAALKEMKNRFFIG